MLWPGFKICWLLGCFWTTHYCRRLCRLHQSWSWTINWLTVWLVYGLTFWLEKRLIGRFVPFWDLTIGGLTCWLECQPILLVSCKVVDMLQ
jgi:hypothetical protein